VSAEHDQLRRALDRVMALHAQLGDQPPAPAVDRSALTRTVAAAVSSYRTAPDLPTDVPDPKQVREQLRALPDAPDGDLAAHATVTAAARAAEQARARLDVVRSQQPTAPQTARSAPAGLTPQRLRELAAVAAGVRAPGPDLDATGTRLTSAQAHRDTCAAEHTRAQQLRDLGQPPLPAAPSTTALPGQSRGPVRRLPAALSAVLVVVAVLAAVTGQFAVAVVAAVGAAVAGAAALLTSRRPTAAAGPVTVGHDSSYTGQLTARQDEAHAFKKLTDAERSLADAAAQQQVAAQQQARSAERAAALRAELSPAGLSADPEVLQAAAPTANRPPQPTPHMTGGATT